jgi:hypothetical protein
MPRKKKEKVEASPVEETIVTAEAKPELLVTENEESSEMILEIIPEDTDDELLTETDSSVEAAPLQFETEWVDAVTPRGQGRTPRSTRPPRQVTSNENIDALSVAQKRGLLGNFSRRTLRSRFGIKI